jgi:zinc transporter 2
MSRDTQSVTLSPGHSHSSGAPHGHSHEGDAEHGRQMSDEAKKRENINVRAAFIHVIGDFIQSLVPILSKFKIKKN